jgi:FkbM family methyltransferase
MINCGDDTGVAMIGALRSLHFIARHPLNRGGSVRALRRYVSWQVAARLGNGAIAVPFVDHTRLLVTRGMHGATGNIYCGLHEFEDMAFVLHALRPAELFVDVGANIGSYTVLAAGVVGARVLAFEPAPGAYAGLLDNLRLNDLQELVEARQEGVGAQPARLAFSTGLDTVNHVLSAAERGGASREVPIVTLDNVLEPLRPCMIKVDVEGYESAVVEGAQRTLRSAAVLAVLMELNGSGTRYGFDEARLHARMLEFGFIPARYDPLARQLHAQQRGHGGNLLYVRDPVTLQARVRAAPRRRVHGTLV